MGGFSFVHIIALAVIAALVLGGGRFSSLMTDVAKGVKNFKKGMHDDDDDDAVLPAARLQKQPPLEPNVDRVPQPMPDDRPVA